MIERGGLADGLIERGGLGEDDSLKEAEVAVETVTAVDAEQTMETAIAGVLD